MTRLLGALLGASLLAGAADAAPKLYVYRWAPPNGPTNLIQFENMLGRKVDGVLDFNDFSQTAAGGASNADWDLGYWQGAKVANIMYAVPLAYSDTSTDQVAAGAADATYTHIGQSLVSHGFPNAYVRLGWEMNGGWYPWGQKDGATFQAAFTHASAVIKAACPGCTVMFNPAAGLGNPAIYMPAGAAGVDAVGFDDYANTWNSGGVTAEPALFNALNTGPWGFISGYPLAVGRGWYTGLPGGAWVPEFGIGARPDSHGACPGTTWADCDDAYGMAQALAAFTAGGVTGIGVWDVNASDYSSEMSAGERPGEALELLKVYGRADLVHLLAGATLYTGSAYKSVAPAGEYQILAQLQSGDVEQLVWGPKDGQVITATDLSAPPVAAAPPPLPAPPLTASVDPLTVTTTLQPTVAVSALSGGSYALNLTLPGSAAGGTYLIRLSKPMRLVSGDGKGNPVGGYWGGGVTWAAFTWGVPQLSGVAQVIASPPQ